MPGCIGGGSLVGGAACATLVRDPRRVGRTPLRSARCSRRTERAGQAEQPSAGAPGGRAGGPGFLRGTGKLCHWPPSTAPASRRRGSGICYTLDPQLFRKMDSREPSQGVGNTTKSHKMAVGCRKDRKLQIRHSSGRNPLVRPPRLWTFILCRVLMIRVIWGYCDF